MMTQGRHTLFLFTLPLCTIGSLTYITTAKGQQIVPDNSLGAESSRVTTSVIKGINSDLIEGGVPRDTNLFHSFEKFNVDTGRGAYFAPGSNIANIFTRVTGSNPSNIQGVLGVLDSNANLFLINPNGILFGQNARLDLGGSFLASTASSFKFPDGSEFSVTNRNVPPLLAVNIPNGLQFRENSKTITNQSQASNFNNATMGLQVNSGKSLALVGGEVSINNGRLTASGGRVELGGLADAGVVEIKSDGSLSYPTGSQRANVSLTENSVVDVRGGGGGTIAVNARNLELSGTSELFAGISQSNNRNSKAGNIDIDVQEAVDLKNESRITNILTREQSGDTGDIIINTGNLSVNDIATVRNRSEGTGNSGNVIINARETILIQNAGQVYSRVSALGTGKTGDINITTNSLRLIDGGQINASTFGNGDAGDVRIEARDISLESGDVDGIDFFPSAIYSNVENGDITDTRQAGNIELKINNLSLKDGAQIGTFIRGNGTAGIVRINATGGISIDGQFDNQFRSVILSNVQDEGQGTAGTVELNARSLSLTNGARLSVVNLNQGAAGSVIVTTSEDIKLDNDASIRALTFGEGGEGNITLNSRNLILRRGSYITTDARGSATGGNITINTGNLVGLENSDITANAQEANAGKIRIHTEGNLFGIAVLSGQKIAELRSIANSEPNIDDPPVTSQFSTSDIAAFSQQSPSLDGAVQINNPEVDPSEELVEFPENVVDPTQQIAQNPCQQSVASRFVVTGRGGLPPSPNQVLGSENVRVDLLAPVASTGNSNSATRVQPSPSPSSTVKQIIPAQGWVFNERGKIVLVADNPNQISSQRSPKTASSCRVETAQ